MDWEHTDLSHLIDSPFAAPGDPKDENSTKSSTMPRTRKHGGCITCRRRCRSCDKKRPACSQCANDGLVCGSYGDIEPQLAWVHATQETMRFNKGYPRPPSLNGSVPPSSPCSTSHAVSEQAVEPETGAGHDDVRLVVHDFLVRSAAEQPFLNRFMFPASPLQGQLPVSPPSEVPADDLMAAIDEFFHSVPSIRLATEAMSTGVLSAISQSPQLWTRSLQAYNQAAAELVKTFKARKRSSQSEGVLATCRVLQMYEHLFGQASGWKAHMEAHMAMYLARGPGGFVSGQAHQLLVDGRILTTILGIGRRTRNPLRTPEWHSIPWQESPKSPADRILDIIEDLIDLLGNVDHLRACRHVEDVERFRVIILAGCQQLEARLHSLDQGADINTRTFDYTATGLPLPPPRNAAELRTLHASGLHWAAHLILHVTVELAGAFSAEPPSHPGVAPAAAASASTYILSPALVAPRSPLPVDSPPPPHLQHRGRVRFGNEGRDSLRPEPEPGTFASKIAHAAPLLLTCPADAQGLDGAAALFAIAMAVHFFASGMGEPSAPEAQMLFDLLGTPSLSALVVRFLARLQGGAMQPAAPASAQKQGNLWLFLVLN